jgi:hypothetical protein
VPPASVSQTTMNRPMKNPPVFFETFVFANFVEFFLIEKLFEESSVPINGNVIILTNDNSLIRKFNWAPYAA